MISVLVVEDSTSKLKDIVEVLKSIGIPVEAISEARSSMQAKSALRDHTFDLLLLDLHIPRRLDDAPHPSEGLNLLQEIEARDKYFKPTNVIAVTAHDEAMAVAQPVFDEALVPIVKYDPTDVTWSRPLVRRVSYILESAASRSAPGVKEYDFDLAICTALESPELSAVLRLPWNWRVVNFQDDDTEYHVGEIHCGGQVYKVVAACAPFMGMPIAAVIASKIIERFTPRYLVHAGIAAGLKGKTEYGDALVADPSWDWGSGKFEMKGNEVVFYAAPYQIPLREELRGAVRRLAQDGATLEKIRADWAGHRPSSTLAVRLGPVASGASVLADGSTSQKIKDQHRKLLGIDMETYAVMAAAEFGKRPRPLAISIKSVCDFADGAKDDTHQPYAAYTSAALVRALFENYVLGRRD